MFAVGTLKGGWGGWGGGGGGGRSADLKINKSILKVKITFPLPVEISFILPCNQTIRTNNQIIRMNNQIFKITIMWICLSGCASVVQNSANISHLFTD